MSERGQERAFAALQRRFRFTPKTGHRPAPRPMSQKGHKRLCVAIFICARVFLSKPSKGANGVRHSEQFRVVIQNGLFRVLIAAGCHSFDPVGSEAARERKRIDRSKARDHAQRV
jgi:hypothetical protein